MTYEGITYIRVKELPPFGDKAKIAEHKYSEKKIQSDLCNLYCIEHGIESDVDYYGYTDDDILLNEAIEYCCAPTSNVDVLVVWGVPHLAYGTNDYIALKKKLDAHGVGLVSVPKDHKVPRDHKWKDPFEVMQAEFIPQPLLKLNK